MYFVVIVAVHCSPLRNRMWDYRKRRKNKHKKADRKRFVICEGGLVATSWSDETQERIKTFALHWASTAIKTPKSGAATSPHWPNMVLQDLVWLCCLEPSPAMHTRGHPYKLFKSQSNTRVRSTFFSERVVNAWNYLPCNTVNFTSLNAFRSSIQRVDFSNYLMCYR